MLESSDTFIHAYMCACYFYCLPELIVSITLIFGFGRIFLLVIVVVVFIPTVVEST